MSTTEHVDLRSLTANVFVDGVYSIYNPQVGATRNGKSFLKCLLRDATGEVAARQWSFDEKNFAELQQTGFVRVAGHSQLYNGQIQFIIEQIKAVEISEEEMAALLPTTQRDIGEMFDAVRTLMGTIEHPGMRALARAYLDDEELMQRFRRAPAAVSIHHAWIGGLLEHTLQLLTMADRILPLYPELNRDIVLVGLFLHDLAKTTELSWQQGFSYSTDGNLIGHVVRGAIWLQVKAAVAARSGHRLPKDALRILQHILISHHGQLEFGAAKVPSTPEAIFVSQLDDLDAKTQLAITAAARGDESAGTAEFTDKVWALGTRLYRPDPLGGSCQPESSAEADPDPAGHAPSTPAPADATPPASGVSLF
ncbi:MAG: HD domain-containing protein [Phycisphaerales bacterium]|nr:HD domain-containing protein [Phycisphaerales bacterium]NNM27740.1 HD domain-containing protein [Phycisphaerales bacterium]